MLRHHLTSAFGFWIVGECFHTIITMRQMVGLLIQYTVDFPPISSCPPDFLNVFFYGIRYAKMAYSFYIWDIYPHS